MQCSYAPTSLSASFDEPNLLVFAGLVPALALGERVGLSDLADEHLTVPGDAGANAGAKLTSIVAGMVAGADSIADLNLLRAGASGRVFTGVRAASTCGSFLRAHRFGHVKQLDAVASRLLTGLVADQPHLVAGIEREYVIDIDDTVKQVFGARKQGAEFGYTRVRGLNAQLATISTGQSAPVIAATRLRRGAKNSAHGATKMLQDTIRLAVRCGADPKRILVRADSAYCTASIVAAVTRTGARFAFAISQNQAVQRAIAEIPAEAWTRIEYSQAIRDPDTGQMVSAAEVAEIDYTAFTSKAKQYRQTARLIVRRIPELNRDKLAAHHDTLFPLYRYHAVFSNSSKPLVEAELDYRQHAIIEQVISDLKAGPLAHLHSGVHTANGAWLACAAMAFNLTRAIAVAAGGTLTKATTATIRARLINIPARIARSARRLRLHLPRNWLWATSWQRAWTHAVNPA